MAFGDDLIGGGTGPDFTADSVLDRVSRSVMPDLPDNANGDMILNRLNRKLSQQSEQREAPKAPAAPKGAPDLSDEGTPMGDLPDLSGEGTPLPDQNAVAAAPAPTSPSLGVTGQAKALAKGLIRGGPEATA